MSRHWHVEQGIGEDRAVLVENGHIIAARIRRHDNAPFVGEVVSGRLQLSPSPHLVTAAYGEVALAGSRAGHSEGEICCARVVRERIGEASGDHRRVKLQRAKFCDAEKPQPAPSLADELAQIGDPVEAHHLAPAPAKDMFAAAGWHELLEEAASGIVPFANGRLIVSPTPGMTVIDVDGSGPMREYALGAARAAAAAILRHDIGGGIAIDFPALETRTDRQAVAEAFDTVMSGPFERTAINGFGLMHVVRKRERPSLVELYQLAPTRSAVLVLLREAERVTNPAHLSLVVDAKGAALLETNPQWLQALAQRIGKLPAIHASAQSLQDYNLATA